MQKFIDAVKANPSLQAELTTAVQNAAIAVAKKHGFEHTVSEMKTYSTSQPIVNCVSTAWTAVCTA